MNKSKVQVLFAAVFVLILLLAVYLCLGRWNKNRETMTETETEQAQILSLAEKDTAKVTIQNKNGTYAFSKEEDSWVYDEDQNFPLEQEGFANLVSKLEDVKAVRTLEVPEALSEYGLENPAITITAEKTDGSQVKLAIGNANETTGDYYAKEEGKDPVYTIESEVAEAFTCSLYDLAKADTFPSITASSVNHLKIARLEADLEFTKSEDGYDWNVKEGDKETGADSAKMDELTAVTDSLSYLSYVDYNAKDLSGYGLEEPAASITMDYTTTEEVQTEAEAGAEEADTEGTEAEAETKETDPEETEVKPETEEADKEETELETVEVAHQVVLEVGNQDEDGNYYVKLKDSKEVYTMSADTLNTWLNVQYADCVDTYVSYVPLTGIKALKVMYQEKTYELTLKESQTTETNEDGEEETGTEYTYYVDGKEVYGSAFTTFYNKVYQMKVQTRLEEEPDAVADPALTLNFERTDGSTLEIRYSEYEGGVYLAQSSETLPGLVSKLEVESLIEAFAGVLS